MRTRSTLVGLTALAVCAGSLVVAAPAYAFGVPVPVSAVTAFDGDPTKSVTVDCPEGMQVLGGGAEVYTFADEGIRIVGLEPDVVNGAWFRADALAEPGHSGDNWTLTVWAFCAVPPRDGLDYDVFTAQATSDQQQSIRPYCEPGKKLVGFGGRVASADDPREVALTAVLPDADLGNVLVIGEETEIGEARPWSVTAYTVCAIVGNGVVYKATGQAPGPVPQTNLESCHASGLRLMALGFAIFSGRGQVGLRYLKPVRASDTTADMKADDDLNGFGFVWHSMIAIICIKDSPAD